MTAQRTDSRLDGWAGPVFPVLIPRLTAALQALPVAERSGANLRARLASIQGLENLVELTATDGYVWPTVALISVTGAGEHGVAGVVAVAIPAPNLDRAPCAYYKGQTVNVETANAIVARVIRALRPNPGHRPILVGP